MHPLRKALHAALAASAFTFVLTPLARAVDANITYTNGSVISSPLASTAALDTPPPGYRTWTSSSGVTASYLYDGNCNCLTIEVENTTTDVQNFGMVSNAAPELTPGQHVRVLSNIEIVSATPEAAKASTLVGVGLEAFTSDFSKTQLVDGPLSSVEQSLLNTPQDAVTYYAAGTMSDRHGVALNVVQPRLKVYNILPGAKIKLKVRSLSMQVTTLTGTWIRPLAAVQSTLPSAPIKLTAELIAPVSLTGYPGYQSAYQSQFRFVHTSNNNTVNLAQRTLVGYVSSQLGTGTLRNSWSFLAPDAAGTYDVYYRLLPPGGGAGITLYPTEPSPTMVASSDGAGGMQYKIGQIKVDWAAPMVLGNAFHSLHPATSAPVQHDIVRSVTHAKTSLNNWWRINPATPAEPVMAWEEGNNNFKEWVDGVSGAIFPARKALITFYGMRTAIADNNTATGAWGASVNPGFISAPSSSGLAVYGRVVRKTVEKFKNAIYAVECWNEPDSTGHFAGTRTQLADICKTVYTQTKAVDNNIKVLCPQATTPAGIGWILGARTSSNQAITDYCDVVGSHLYGYTGDNNGRAYSLSSVSNAIKDMKNRIAQFPGAVNKALAVTEFGTNQCLWNGGYTAAYPAATVSSDNNLKGNIVYDSLLSLKEQNIRTVALYSYDHGAASVGGCVLGTGYSWQYYPPVGTTPGTPNTPVINRINDAVGF